jgi:hypothetical protein
VTVDEPAINQAPAADLTSPVNGAVYSFGSVIELAAVASDADGEIARVEFFLGDTKIGEDGSAPYELDWGTAAPGANTFTAVAVDDSGARTRSTEVSVTVTSDAGSTAVVLQNGQSGYQGTQDAFLLESNAGGTYGGRDFLMDKASGKSSRTLVKFAVFQSEGGPVPDGAIITGARLSLYKSSSYDHQYRVHPLLADWNESEVSWRNREAGLPWSAPGAQDSGADVANDADGQASTGWNPGWIEFDVTSGLQAMTEGRANFGWVLEPVSGNNNAKRLRSSEYEDASLRPRLEVTYVGDSDPDNVAPEVALDNSLAGAQFDEGEVIELNATASDADGSVARVEFYQGDSKLGEDNKAPYAYAWRGAAPGNYLLTARAIDDQGATTVSSAVSITVAGDGQSYLVRLQEGLDGYQGSRDAYLSEFHANVNFGDRDNLLEKQSGSRKRTLLGFRIFQSDGGPVPDGATITSAQLQIYKSSSYDQSYRLNPLLVEWNEYTVTWNERQAGVSWNEPGGSAQGNDLGGVSDGEASVGWDPGWLSFDVAEGIQAMSDGRVNYGWMLEPVTGNNNTKRLLSSESSIQELRPRLDLTYTLD